jgi:type IV secretion system protein VirB5
MIRQRSIFAFVLMFIGFMPAAHAQWAVVDVGAITQLIQQVQTMREQLTTARDQLTEARRQIEAMSGGRGMEWLLAGTARNYLPGEWAEVAAVLDQTSGAYGALARELENLVNGNAILSPQQIAALSPAERTQLESARRTAAMLQLMTRQALARTSSRFDAIQQLIDAISGASDQKAILDLQARIQAEQGMLQNESTKLQVLYQLSQAEELSRRQRTREQAIASIGSLRRLPPIGL